MPVRSLRYVAAALAIGFAWMPSARSEERATPAERHTIRDWGISVLMFRGWRPAPLDGQPTPADGDPRRHLVAHFLERDEAEQRSSGWRAGVAEVYAAGAKPGGGPGDAEARVDMRQLLLDAAGRRGFRMVRLDPRDGASIRSKDGVKGTMWAGETDRAEHAAFSVWEREGTQVGVWIGGGRGGRARYELGFQRVVQSLLWTDERATATPLAVLDGVALTPPRRRRIETGLVRGWEVLVSPRKRYVVVYNTKGGRNTRLARVVAERAEAIRSQLYEVHFPPEGSVDAVSVIRVCADRAEYLAYGGPPGSAGYWSERAEELVLYDASPARAIDEDTMSVLYHEAFHQYIYYCAGGIAPHPWFDEGHGDYYAGARFVDGKFVITPFRWRLGTIQTALSGGPPARTAGLTVVTTKKLVSLSQLSYYLDARSRYAQGWSLVWFLREIVPKDPELRAKWGAILDTYFRTLRARASSSPVGPAPSEDASGERPPPQGPETAAGADGGIPFVLRELLADRVALDAALEAGFEGVDFDDLHLTWAESIARISRPK